MDRNELISTVVKWAKSHGFKDIRANIEGYDTPKSYERAADSQLFTPDVTATNMFNKHYLEVSMKTDALRSSVSKWKLLSELASLKGGKLYLMAPRGHVRFTRDVVAEHNIPAEVVRIS